MTTWAMRQRHQFIRERITSGGRINRADLVERFTITKQTATAELHRFEVLYPGLMAYDGRLKSFVRSDLVTVGAKTPPAPFDALGDTSLFLTREKCGGATVSLTFANVAPAELTYAWLIRVLQARGPLSDGATTRQAPDADDATRSEAERRDEP